MAKVYSDSESVEAVAQRLIPMYHPELSTARIKYIFVDKAGMRNGRPRMGKVNKVTGAYEYLLEMDFIVEVASDQWNEQTDRQRQALIDHLLEQCTGEEDENTGDMKWVVREPDIHEFSAILRRHGAWNGDLTTFVSVAKEIDIEGMVNEVINSSTVRSTTT
jgi:FAD/FMN-containing dehydrogenase